MCSNKADKVVLGECLSVVVIWVIFFQTELMVEIYHKSLVRANGELLLMKFSYITN